MKAKTIRSILLLIAAGTFWAASATAQDFESLVKAEGVYTLVNLHPDPENKRLYTVNYQQPGLIPVCTPVTITKLTRKAMIFEADGQEYEYLLHKTLPIDFQEHLAKFFGTDCPKSKVANLSERDREGVDLGRAVPGMSREGVLIAMGPPPSHANSLDANQWTYWQNRWGKMRVEFDGDRVSRVVD